MSLFGRRRGGRQSEISVDQLPGRLPWKPREDDVGLRIVDAVGHALSLDEEWCICDGRGFTWWGKDLAQRVWSEPGVDDNGFEIFRLHARTELFREFEPTDENLAKLNTLGIYATTNGFLVDSAARMVSLAASMYAHAEVENWVGAMFKVVVAMQAADAQIKVDNFADLFGFTVAATPHPSSGARREYDDMLDIFEGVVARGRQASTWEGSECLWALETLQGGYSVLATGGSTGLTAEFPFQSRTTLLRVATEESNPQLGNGVLLVLSLPMNIDESEGLRFGASLARRELQSMTWAHYLGGWCWADEGLHYVTFLPNRMNLAPGGLTNMVTAGALRAKWVAEAFCGDDWDTTETTTVTR